MTDESPKPLSPLIVEIELGSELERFRPPHGDESESFKSTLKLYLQDLVSDLELPLSVHINIRIDDGLNAPLVAPRWLRLRINRRRVRLAHEGEIEESTVGSGLAKRLARFVVQQPRSLMNNKIVTAIKEQWAMSGVPWFKNHMSSDDFLELLEALTSRGFRIGRAMEWARLNSPPASLGQEPDLVFEEVVAPVGSCSLTALLGGRLYAEALATAAQPKLGTDDASFDGLMRMLRDGMFYELGVYLPRVKLGEETVFAGDVYRFRFNDRRLLPQPGLASDQIMVNAPAEELEDLGIKGDESVNPANGNPVTLVPEVPEVVSKLREEGYWTWDRLGYVTLALAAEIRLRAGDFQMRGVETSALTSLAQAFPGLVSAARGRFGDDKLTRVFRGVADDHISIRDQRAMLEALLTIRRTVEVDFQKAAILLNEVDACAVASIKSVAELTVDELVSHCRRSQKRHISQTYAPTGILSCFVLDPSICDRLRERGFDSLFDSEYDDLIRGVGRSLEQTPEGVNPVIVAPLDVRQLLRQTIRISYPYYYVLCREELAPNVQLNVLGQLTWQTV